jgi:hypothetical protein
MNPEDSKEPRLNTAAIVCEHVARNGAPILFAEKSQPQDDADSGWQFVCGTEEENWQNAQVWALREMLSLDSSLKPYLEMPWGTVLRRPSVAARWKRMTTT